MFSIEVRFFTQNSVTRSVVNKKTCRLDETSTFLDNYAMLLLIVDRSRKFNIELYIYIYIKFHFNSSSIKIVPFIMNSFFVVGINDN